MNHMQSIRYYGTNDFIRIKSNMTDIKICTKGSSERFFRIRFNYYFLIIIFLHIFYPSFLLMGVCYNFNCYPGLPNRSPQAAGVAEGAVRRHPHHHHRERVHQQRRPQ